jgi:hypothetical protein
MSKTVDYADRLVFLRDRAGDTLTTLELYFSCNLGIETGVCPQDQLVFSFIVNVNGTDIRPHMPGDHDYDIVEQILDAGAAFKYPVQLADVQQQIQMVHNSICSCIISPINIHYMIYRYTMQINRKKSDGSNHLAEGRGNKVIEPSPLETFI